MDRIKLPVRYDPNEITIFDVDDVEVGYFTPAGRDEELDAIGEQIADALNNAAKLASDNQCDACGGTGQPVSGIPCMCGGSGKMSDAARYLRTRLVEQETKLASAVEVLNDAKVVIERSMTYAPDGPDYDDLCTVRNRIDKLLKAHDAEGK